MSMYHFTDTEAVEHDVNTVPDFGDFERVEIDGQWYVPVRTCRIVISIDRSPASYGGRVHRCSSCGKALPGALFGNGWIQLDYCPRCGARVTEVVRNERDYL